SMHDIEGTILPVGEGGAGVTGRLVVLRDITEEMAVARLREELTNMIVHDLRAPLSGVVSSLRLIEDMVANNELSDFQQVLNIALTSSENQMPMIESMLEIDKLEKGQMPLHIEVTSLDPLVQKSISSLDILANAAHIRVLDCIPKNLPQLLMDGEQIRRVVTNLLDNALRHTPTEG